MISRLALYFGTTWLVNCVSLTAILLVLVTANVYVTRYKPSRLGPYYVLLIAFLLMLTFGAFQAIPLAKVAARRSATNDRRCMAIQLDMLSAHPRRADGPALFHALGCVPTDDPPPKTRELSARQLQPPREDAAPGQHNRSGAGTLDANDQEPGSANRKVR